jgi:hypothetical protein
MSKNILIRDLTERQNERLLLLQKKFGVKTNSQAMLLLLRFCIISDDEVAELIGFYKELSATCLYTIREFEKNDLDFSKVEKVFKLSMDRICKYQYFLNLKK